MTDRGLPIVDGAPACPFVAFEDDRDERATSPDHRHRCYAEARPAPRALAHQEAYCLASSFPVCPTFQDWARREAANARQAHGGDSGATADDAPRRNPPREWSAPPPWAGGPVVPGYGGDDDDDDPDAPDFLAGRTRPELGLAGSAGDRVAIAGGGAEDDREARARDVGTARDEEQGGRDAAAAGAAMAGAAAGPPRESVPRPTPSGDRAAEALDDAVDDYDDFGERLDDRRDADRDRDDDRRKGGRDGRAPVGDSRGSRPVPGSEAPSWERPRRYEAYPTLKTPVRMPALSRVAVGALLLLVAAAVLFLLPSVFLGGSGGKPGTGGATTSAPSAVASGSAAPSVSVAPTPRVYVVAPGDSLGKIAKKFGLTVDQILAANKQITDANKIAIGDKIVIPSAEASAPEDSAAP